MKTQFELPRMVTLPHMPNRVMWLSFPRIVDDRHDDERAILAHTPRDDDDGGDIELTLDRDPFAERHRLPVEQHELIGVYPTNDRGEAEATPVTIKSFDFLGQPSAIGQHHAFHLDSVADHNLALDLGILVHSERDATYDPEIEAAHPSHKLKAYGFVLIQQLDFFSQPRPVGQDTALNPHPVPDLDPFVYLRPLGGGQFNPVHDPGLQARHHTDYFKRPTARRDASCNGD